MGRALRSAIAIAAIAAAVVGASALAGDAPAHGPYRIVTLHAGDPSLPTLIAVDQAMRAELAARLGRDITYHIETLDMMRFPPQQFEAETVALLRKRYEGLKVDIVVPAGAAIALDFAERHLDEIWPGAAIVFRDVQDSALRGRKLGPRTTGLPVRIDFEPTIEMALRMLPATRRIAVVAGTGAFDGDVLALARTALAGPAAKAIEVEYLTDLTLPETLAAVRKLPPNSLVLYTSMLRDGAGLVIPQLDGIVQVAAAASAPTFGVFEAYLGEGIVGGWGNVNQVQGQYATELVVRVLKGVLPADLGVPATPLVCFADWRQLERWKIDESRLPRDCDVRYRTYTAWEQYRWVILATLALILAQAALIAALLAQRRWRRRAEHELEARRVELLHAARLATAGQLTATIAHEVNQPLGAILANVGAAEIMLASGDYPVDAFREILEDVRNANLRASDVIGRLRQLLAKHEVKLEPLDVNAVVEEVLHLLAAEARRRQVALIGRYEESLPIVSADRVHLQQVLINLVMNAMDAMADTPASLRSVVVRTSHGPNGVEVAVMDRGHGIPPDGLDRIFDSFYTTKERGMGLGLSIARSIIAAHGGRIWAENQATGGSVFHFTLR